MNVQNFVLNLFKVDIKGTSATVCMLLRHVRAESTLHSCLNVKEPRVRNRRNIYLSLALLQLQVASFMWLYC